ncbi:unnamed protein product [Rangifer tarandus platyrhynchus]|uniref:Uncharacterized protein n=1 Tax=Rangifer tarandus platyrhynchus TaxID=3082113 RepID=A0AC59ZWJ9_RANTA
MSKASLRFSRQEGGLKEGPNEALPRVNCLQLEGKAGRDEELKSKADSLRERREAQQNGRAAGHGSRHHDGGLLVPLSRRSPSPSSSKPPVHRLTSLEILWAHATASKCASVPVLGENTEMAAGRSDRRITQPDLHGSRDRPPAHLTLDAQSRRSRGLPGFLPGASDPDHGFHIAPSNPGDQAWQRAPPPPGNLPPGLEYLSQLDLIIIHQQVELLGMILGTETANKYEIKNSLGQRIYFAVEESICFNRTFCSTLRSCILKITDNSGQEVITVNRPLRCNSCWCPCYLQELEIQAPPGSIVGYVAQKWDPFLPKFTIQNANKEDILKIVGPCATCGCFGDVDFEVKTINEKLTIGKISKYWSGFVNDVFTNADNFGIHVPADLDVTVKAAMIGACFLFDFMFFEHSLAGL